MHIPSVYFDEAGNSGDNLLDCAQPVYTLFSHDFNAQETVDILLPLTRISRAEELKFKNVKKYVSQQKALISVLNNPLIQNNRIYYFYTLKEYTVIIQMVDKLFEVLMYHKGVDIYRGGWNIATANLIYHLSIHRWNKSLWSIVCDQFVKWGRSADQNDGELFYKSLQKLNHSLKDFDEKEILCFLLESKRYIREIQSSFGKFMLDVTVPCFTAHCTHWAHKYKNKFDACYDVSKQMEHHKKLIEFLIYKVPEREVGFGSRKHTLPLKINKLISGDSKLSLQLQLADLLAGSSNAVIKGQVNKQDDDLTRELMQTRLPNLHGNSMFPSTKMTAQELDMEDLSGENPLDFIAEHAIREGFSARH